MLGIGFLNTTGKTHLDKLTLSHIKKYKIKNPIEILAIDNFIKGLTLDRIIHKMYAIYLISPTSLAASLGSIIHGTGVNTRNLTAINTIGHNANGIETNGTNSYLRSEFDPTSVSAKISNWGYTVYSGTAGSKAYDWGVGASPSHFGALNISGFIALHPVAFVGAANELKVNTITKSATSIRRYVDGALSGAPASNTTTTALSSDKPFLGAYNSGGGTPAAFSQRRYKTFAIHQDLNNTEALALRNLIINYNQSLPTPR